MRLVAFAALLVAAAPALAAQSDVHRGQVLLDANKVRLGVIDSVATDGTVGVIVDGVYDRIPAASVNMVDGKLLTTLTKHDLRKH